MALSSIAIGDFTMSEPIETKPAETVAPVQDEAVDIKALAAQLEAIKKAQAGSDKAYQETAKKAKELEAENERLKKERMSEKEKAEYEIAQQKAQLEVRAREVANATLRLSKIKILGEKNVPMDFADYITGNTDEEIKTNLDTFLQRFDTAVQARVNEKLSGTQKPQAGSEPAKVNLDGKSFKELETLARQGKL
jgi:DNA repair exonuclease SbcCD ATPase subunit